MRRGDVTRYENSGPHFHPYLFFPSFLFARDNTDIIVMKNGDRMTCEIKALSAGVLSVKLNYVQGTIGVQWSEVAHLESNQLFLVTDRERHGVYRQAVDWRNARRTRSEY